MRLLGICLSDIPKDKMRQGKDGKIYVNIIVTEMKQADMYGNDLTVYVQQTKEEREDKMVKSYIGKGKTFNFGASSSPSTEDIGNMPPAETDDLPW